MICTPSSALTQATSIAFRDRASDILIDNNYGRPLDVSLIPGLIIEDSRYSSDMSFIDPQLLAVDHSSAESSHAHIPAYPTKIYPASPTTIRIPFDTDMLQSSRDPARPLFKAKADSKRKKLEDRFIWTQLQNNRSRRFESIADIKRGTGSFCGSIISGPVATMRDVFDTFAKERFSTYTPPNHRQQVVDDAIAYYGPYSPKTTNTLKQRGMQVINKSWKRNDPFAGVRPPVLHNRVTRARTSSTAAHDSR